MLDMLFNMNSVVVNEWLTDDLKKEVCEVFEPRYKRKLTEDEVEEIAQNLTSVLETFFKFEYEHQTKPNENENRISESR